MVKLQNEYDALSGFRTQKHNFYPQYLTVIQTFAFGFENNISELTYIFVLSYHLLSSH